MWIYFETGHWRTNMKRKRFKTLLSTVLLGTMLITAGACGEKFEISGDDLTKGIKAESSDTIDTYNEEDNREAFNFSMDLFKSNLLCDNTLISPISVFSALGMTANGARENTLAQMEEVFGLSREKINKLLELYKRNLPDEDKLKVNMANSIWFKEDESFNVNENFLQTNANYYDAAIYEAPFDDTTLKSINDWVSDETDGMIENILEEIPDDVVMYLINALSFVAEWDSIYNENDIVEGAFAADDGTTQTADMMYSEENKYIEDGEAKGFIKNYAGGKYAFVAMLPPEDLHLSAYVSGLSSDKLRLMIKNAKDESVNVMMPKFTTEYEVEMSDILVMMGMEDAFDKDKADLRDLGTAGGNLYISRVIHKTKIDVDEKGTKAGAATMVEIREESAQIDGGNTVYLDRPFLYLIVDTESYLPLFIGTTLYVE